MRIAKSNSIINSFQIPFCSCVNKGVKCLFDDLALVILLFFYAFIVDFEQVNTGWAIIPKCLYRKDRLEEIVSVAW